MVEIDGVKYEYPVNYEWPKDMLRVRDEMMKKFKIGEFVKNAIKEATMIDYEKKYKEALGWMQSQYKWLDGTTKEDAEHYFPELKESEDERIRKSLIILLQHFCKGYRVPGFDFPVSYKDMLAWLEKQGEPAREDLDSEALEEEIKRWIGCEAFPEGTDITPLPKAIEIVKNTAYHFAKFQKPVVWSEEDEIRLSHILRLLDVRDDKKYLLVFGLNSLQDLEKDIVWLKSLKDRIGG